jgi:hypothetical protein
VQSLTIGLQQKNRIAKLRTKRLVLLMQMISNALTAATESWGAFRESKDSRFTH